MSSRNIYGLKILEYFRPTWFKALKNLSTAMTSGTKGMRKELLRRTSLKHESVQKLIA